jgi:DNA-binding PadR family transcriptional regulator
MSDQPQPARPVVVPPPRRQQSGRRRALPKTPLALAVMNLLNERSMHPYEMKTMMLERGHQRAVRLKESSLYDTVERLSRLGFIEVAGVSREGRRPERTVYSITGLGRDELQLWLQDLIAVPTPEYGSFDAALMFVYALGKTTAITALARRAALLDAEISRSDAFRGAFEADFEAMFPESVAAGVTEFPRLFGIEEEYAQAMRRAQLGWVRQIASELRDGSLPWPDIGDPEGNADLS